MRAAWRVAGVLAALVVVSGMMALGCAPVSGGRPSVAVAAEETATPGIDTATSTVDATPAVPPSSTVVPNITVAAVGDLLFDSAPKRLIRAEGGTAPFTKVASRLKAADVTVGNLECPLSRRGSPVPNKTFTFQGDPRAVKGLTYAGFDFLSLANNHARDYGATALADTFTNLRAAGLRWAGAGRNRTEAWKPAFIERGGARIAYLAFSEITPANFAATSSRSGTAYSYDTDKVMSAIKAAKKQADYVIVSFHWGIERNYSPTARQVGEGRRAIRAGADMVLAQHPHVIQGVEFYRDGLIAYSLGNFVFSPGNVGGRDTMILHATMTPSGITSVTAEPCWIGYNGRPVPQTGSVAKRILGVIKKTSTSRGTTVRISGSIARLRP